MLRLLILSARPLIEGAVNLRAEPRGRALTAAMRTRPRRDTTTVRLAAPRVSTKRRVGQAERDADRREGVSVRGGPGERDAVGGRARRRARCVGGGAARSGWTSAPAPMVSSRRGSGEWR